jgi:hypothetical protein
MSRVNDQFLQLPFRLELFGGKDASHAAFDEDELRTPLFDFKPRDGRTYRTVEVDYLINGTRIEKEFSIPQGLDFEWKVNTTQSFVTGETKSDYQSSLSKEMGLSGSAEYAGIGFGLEVENSFAELTLEETYEKYVSSYERCTTYNTRFVDQSPKAVRTWLSDSAIALFASKDAKKIVDALGTHYMTGADFGGVRRSTSKSKIIDSTVSTYLGEAFGFKLKAEGEQAGGEVNASIKDASETTRKFYNTLENYWTATFGGLPDETSMAWATTLFENPIVNRSTLAPLDELIIDDQDLKIAVRSEIESRLKATMVTSKLAVAYLADFGGATNDANSGAHDSKSSALSCSLDLQRCGS